MQRSDSGYTAQRILKMEMADSRKRKGQQRKHMDGVTEDVQKAGMTEEDKMNTDY